MRVLVISNMYPAPQAPTFGIFVRNQVEQLQAHELDITVAAIRDPRNGKANVLKKYARWVLGTMTRFSTRYDLVHAHYAFPSGWLAKLYSKIRRVPYIVTVHGGDLNKMAKKGAFFKKQTKSILKNAAHVIAVGPALYEEIIQEYGVSEDRVSLINMGVNRNVFHQRTDVPSPFDKEKKHILFAGNIIKQKGITELISAFHQLYEDDPKLQLHLVGSFQSEAYKEQIVNQIEGMHLPKEAVLFHGPKTQDELAIHMTYADVFVLPSHIEGFGLVVLESMSCGTPVVASNVGGLPSLLSDEAGVLIEPEQPESLKRGIDAVLYDESLRKQLVQAGYKKADANETEKIIARILTIYNDTTKRDVS
ncbi:hypothetical protein DH09_10630 [Bacillaceae bacterium JMAK1]|nr:hypothetical protein DH09_10630 [Bacillaceae bacterium JMAK1]